MKNSFSKEPSLQNKRAVNIANKMGKRYTLLDAMLMGKKLKIDWKKSKFTMGDLLVGMHYELEHGKVDADTNVTNDNALKTAKIAWAHLKERPDYYVQLMKIDPPKKMEKKASDELNDMVKEAAPRWRKEWGGLSADSQKRLQMPGQIASRKLETAKRMSGVEKVSQKFGIKRHSDSMPQFRLPGKNHPKLRAFVEGTNKVINDIGHMVGPHSAKIGKYHYTFNPMEANNDKWLTSDTGRIFGELGGKDLQKLKYQNKPLYDEISSIASGHEMLGEALTKKNKKHLLNYFGKLRYHKHNPSGPYASHEGPSVMHWESAAIATASPEAKEFFKKLRSQPHDIDEKSLAARVYRKKGLSSRGTTEMSELKDIGGIEYGKDAIINKAKEKAHRAAYRNEISPLWRRGRK
jgi:hypothetical protein